MLLNCIKRQIRNNTDYENIIKIYVYDNCSLDDTSKVVDNYEFDINYIMNDGDIGADNNIYQCYTSIKGKYVWVIGDDELMPINAIHHILKIINYDNPNLIINTANKGTYPTCQWRTPLSFPDYKSFSYFAQSYDPYFLIAHSLMSFNIILKDCFDAEIAKRQINTHYGHFYGIASGLKKHPGKVVLPKEKTLIIRKNRAQPVDGKWPDSLLNDQVEYLKWLAREYNLENFEPTKVIFPFKQEKTYRRLYSKFRNKQISEIFSHFFYKNSK